MPVRAKRVCRGRGCGNVTDSKDGYCAQCTAAGRNDSAESRRNKQTDPFYLSPQWRKFSRWWRSLHPLCSVCGREGQMVDHKTPISRGGAKLDPDNVQTMCWRCHNRKTGRERSEVSVPQGRSGSLQPHS